MWHGVCVLILFCFYSLRVFLTVVDDELNVVLKMTTVASEGEPCSKGALDCLACEFFLACRRALVCHSKNLCVLCDARGV